MELFLESKHFRVTVHWNVLVNNTITNVLITRKTLRYCVSQTPTSRCWLIVFQLPEQQPGVFTAGTITSCVTQTKMPNNPETPFLFCFKSQGLTRSPVWRSTWTLSPGSTQTSSETSSWQKPRQSCLRAAQSDFQVAHISAPASYSPLIGCGSAARTDWTCPGVSH